MIGKIKETWFLLLSLPLYAYLAYFTDRSDADQVILVYFTLFLLYFFWIKHSKKDGSFIDVKLKKLLLSAVVVRAVFLFSYPALSDDFYRFIFDGQLLVNGINPYLILPSDFPGIGVFNELIKGMNSPYYYTVYPPVLQALFAASAFVSSDDILGSVVFMRLVVIAAEIGTILVIYRILEFKTIGTGATLLYAFNPLVVVELTGNLHMEALMFFFFTIAVYLLMRKDLVWSSIFWAIAICSKLIPLMLLPALIPLLGLKRAVSFYLRVFAVVLILSLPFVSSELVLRFYSSLNLYFQNFEFNASLYYLLREVGYWIHGYNTIQTIGPILALIATSLILYLQLRKSNSTPERVFHSWIYAIGVYLIFATTVHPWYITTLVLLSCFNTTIYYALVWSALVVISYHHYSLNQSGENYILLTIEYLPVFVFMILDVIRKQKERKSIEWKL